MKKLLWSFFELAETIVIALAIVLVVRTFVFQPFLVVGSSMEPTFNGGNYLLVDELTYRFRPPERGEVVVFKSPVDKSSYYIKRIIGLPGEHIKIQDGKVFIYENNKLKSVQENYIINPRLTEQEDIVLGPDEYFVMGDNRGFSFDSRSWGPLDDKFIVGLVRLRLWPITQAMAVGKPVYNLK